jgi:hypothetical protein
MTCHELGKERTRKAAGWDDESKAILGRKRMVRARFLSFHAPPWWSVSPNGFT